jgi:hypothetical protein
VEDLEQQLNAILSSPETMEQIFALAGSLSGGASDPGPKKSADESAATPDGATPETQPPKAELSGLSGLLPGLEPNLMARLLPLLRTYQSGTSEQQALLAALKPFLRPESQKKVDRAIQITRLSKVIRASMGLLGEGRDV